MSPTREPERGPTGDHGQDGTQGQQGETGLTGLTGQTGQAGAAGATGAAGQAGSTGQAGATGTTGAAGTDAPRMLTRLQVLVLVGFVVLAFIVLAFRTEANSRDTRHAVMVGCERVNRNTDAINEFLDLLIANTKLSTVLTPAEVRQRIAGYESTKQAPIKC